MTGSPDWARVRAAFEAALDRADADRDAWLVQACGDDAALLAEVRNLLAAERAHATLPIDRALDTSAVEASLDATWRGRRIGEYEVEGLLGAGGMSTVFVARQQRPQRRVALKTMRLGATSATARARFRYESQVLARLRHPAIAQVFEVGSWRDPLGGEEQPFFAMELVADARTLVDFVRERGLDVRATLELFIRVCDGVEHGHRHGFVHRDLKPANILVDADGHPKIIDFGIARALGDDEAALTEAGQLLGTLQYMAPEQLDTTREPVDTRADVYALGVLLYELLTGAPPHRLGDDGMATFARRVLEEPVRLPSRARPALSREIDWILGMALAVDRDARYGSAAASTRPRLMRAVPRTAAYSAPCRTSNHRTVSTTRSTDTTAGVPRCVRSSTAIAPPSCEPVEAPCTSQPKIRGVGPNCGPCAGSRATRRTGDSRRYGCMTRRWKGPGATPEVATGAGRAPGISRKPSRAPAEGRRVPGDAAPEEAILRDDASIPADVGVSDASWLCGGPGHARMSAWPHPDRDRSTEAEELFLVLAAREPGSAHWAFHVGDARGRQGRLTEAIACFRRAVELDPEDPLAHGNLGSALANLVKLDDAIVCFRRAIDLDPGAASVLGNLGVALANQGALDEALDMSRRSLELSSSKQDAHSIRLAARAQQRIDQLLDELGRRQALQRVLRREQAPASASEFEAAARLGCSEQRFQDVVAMTEAVLAAAPELVGGEWDSYNPACAAALSAAGAGPLAADERARPRGLARTWLSRAVATWCARLDGQAAAPGTARQMLAHALQNPDFASVRGASIDALPVAERGPWREVWTAIEAAPRSERR